MSDDIVVRVNGDTDEVFNYVQRAETAATSAETANTNVQNLAAEAQAAVNQAETYSQQSQDSANSSANSNTRSGLAADRAEAAAERAENAEPSLETQIDGVSLSNKTALYNFLSPLTISTNITDQFNIGVDLSDRMLNSVYDPNGVNGDAFARANHTGEQAISSITGLQAVLDSKLDDSGTPGDPNPALMAKAVYDPNGVNDNAFARANHTGEQAITTVTGLQAALDAKVDDSEFTGANIANLYESLGDTNKFSNTYKDKVDSITAGANMLTSVFDPNGVNGDAFDGANLSFSGIDENTILSVVGGKLVDSGAKIVNGSIQASTNSVSIGPHTNSSAGENLMWKNEITGNLYSVPWIDIDRANAPPPTYRYYTDTAIQTFVTTFVQDDEITNPEFPYVADDNYRIFEFEIKSARDTTGVNFELFKEGVSVWRQPIGDLTLNTVKNFSFDTNSVPFDAGDTQNFTVRFYTDSGADVVLFGDSALDVPFVRLYVRTYGDGYLQTQKRSMTYTVANDGEDIPVNSALDCDMAGGAFSLNLPDGQPGYEEILIKRVMNVASGDLTLVHTSPIRFLNMAGVYEFDSSDNSLVIDVNSMLTLCWDSVGNFWYFTT